MKAMLQGKRVVVTGAGQGIGRGIAEAVAEAGADVGLIDLNADGLGETRRVVEDAGQRAVEIVANVVDTDAMSRSIERVVAELGPLDGLVNNAGVIEMQPASEVTRDAWDKQFEVNVWGLMSCCQLAANLRDRACSGLA